MNIKDLLKPLLYTNDKIDVKNIIIMFLFISSIVLFTMWNLSGTTSKDHKTEIERLNAANKEIKDERDALQSEFVALKGIFEKDSMEFAKLKIDYYKIDIKLKEKEKSLQKAKDDLKNYKKSLDETRHKIEELEKNPTNRKGDDLLNSIKNKTK